MNRTDLSIALMTPIHNPSKQQVNNLVATYESLNDVIDCFYVGISSQSTNIELVKDALKDFNCKINVADDEGPDDALLKLTRIIKEDFVWLVTCGEIIKIKDTEFLKQVEKESIIFGDTTFINEDGTFSKMHPKKFNRFYKYKIPILNLSSCIIYKDYFIKSSPARKYKVATDYEQILRLYSYELNLQHTSSFELVFFNDGNSIKNKVTGMAEMYHISKYFYPQKNVLRIIFYSLFLLKHKINPFKFLEELSKIDNYVN